MLYTNLTMPNTETKLIKRKYADNHLENIFVLENEIFRYAVPQPEFHFNHFLYNNISLLTFHDFCWITASCF